MPEQETPQEQQPTPNQRKKHLLVALGGIGLLIAIITATVLLFNQEDAQNGNTANEETAEEEESAEELQLSEASTEIPEDFPDYIEIYEPSELLTSSTFGQDESNNWVVTFETDSNIDAIYEFYEDYFSAESWEVLSVSSEDEPSRTITASNEDLGSEVSVSASASEDDFTSFSISIAEQRPQQ